MSHKMERSDTVAYNRAKLWQIVCFAMNNSSSNMYIFTFSYITYFATGILGLAAIAISQIMGYIRIFDGVIDPAIGIIIDKTDTKFGKYRPIIILGNLITAASFWFLFNIDMFGQSLRFPMFLLALIVHKIGYSFQQTVTKAGQTALTNDPKQRPIFNMVDGIVTTALSTAVAYVITNILVKQYGGFTGEMFDVLVFWVISISAVLGVIAIIGIWQKDRKEYFGLGEKTQKTDLKDYWKVLKGNKPLQVLSLSAALVKFVTQLFSDAVMTVMLFAILFGNYDLAGNFSLLVIIPGMIINFAFSAFARRKGLRTAYVLALKIGIIGLLSFAAVLFFGEPGKLSLTHVNLYTILFCITYIVGRYVSSVPSSLVLTMGADISDYETSVSGRYVSGMIGTIFSLTDSIASSFAPMVIGWGVAAIGFTKEYPTVGTPLTPELKWVTILLIAVIPAAFLCISLFLMHYYKLDVKEMTRIQEKIHVMKAAKDEERVRDIAKNVPLSDMEYVDLSKYPLD